MPAGENWKRTAMQDLGTSYTAMVLAINKGPFMPQTVLDKFSDYRAELDRRAAEIERLRAVIQRAIDRGPYWEWQFEARRALEK